MYLVNDNDHIVKNQTISKANYGLLNSLKKRTNYHYPEHVLSRKFSE